MTGKLYENKIIQLFNNKHFGSIHPGTFHKVPNPITYIHA